MEGEGERDRVREGESVWVVSGGKKNPVLLGEKSLQRGEEHRGN